MGISFKPEVIADSSGTWTGNALRFATRQEALDNVADLASRWMLVRDTRVVESDDPVNYTYIDRKLKQVVACQLCGQHIYDGKPCGCGFRKEKGG